MRARDRDDVPQYAGARYGLKRGVVGIGHVEGEKGARMLHRFAGLPDGTFVWTRVGEDAYRLGRIAGPLREDHSAPAQAVGIQHVRPASWLERIFTGHEIPRAVAATFARGGRNLQRTHDDEAERRTAELWSLS